MSYRDDRICTICESNPPTLTDGTCEQCWEDADREGRAMMGDSETEGHDEDTDEHEEGEDDE